MKNHFSLLQRLTLAALLSAAGGSSALATIDTWVNSGTITFPPQIDATNVFNSGTISISTLTPFDTSNTRNFTNTGTIRGSVGFKFDTAPRNSSGVPTAPRRLAANFHNRNGGIVSALDGPLINGYSGSYLYVHATNIISQGILSIDPGGLLQIVGTNVNLTRSGLGVNSIVGTGSFNDFPTNGTFYPDQAIYDNWWGQTNDTFGTAGIINSFGPLLYVISPPHRVSNIGASGFVQLLLVDPQSDAYSDVVAEGTLTVTNDVGDTEDIIVATNILRQAVFVGASDPTNFAVSIRFYPSSIPTNLLQTVAVELLVGNTNTITAQSGFSSLYFVDTLAGETNRGLAVNYLDGTARPANYLVSRVPVAEFFFGQPGNTAMTNNYLYDTNFASPVSSGEYAGYSAFVDNLISRPTTIPAGTVTNLPGRLEVQADSLDLTKTRLRAEGLMKISARHLLSSSNAVVDGENLAFYLGSTNGNLRVQNLLNETVARMKGDIYAWSGLWTNSYSELITNYSVDSDGNATLSPITNVVFMTLHCLMLDATTLLNILPVTIYDLQAKSTNVVVSTNDHGFVAQSFYLDADSFTLDGSIAFSNVLRSWVYTNAPKMKFFTNNGALTIPNEAHFGDDGPSHYVAFVNRGTIRSLGQFIYSDYAELGGTNFVGAAFHLHAGDGKVENGRIAAIGDATFLAGTLKFHRSLVETTNRLYLSVSGALYDNGGASSNTLSCRDGFVLTAKPTLGDLLGTTFRSAAPNFASVGHQWAADNRGADKSGFANNAAIGRLVPVGEGFDPYFVFSGTGASNALYVDYLDLSQLTDYTSQLEIDPNFVIYYAAAKLAFVPPGSITPEEYLNGQFDGRLRWVQNFAGPNSSVDVFINGTQTIQVNKALRNSTTIDSDADGIPNYYDLTPFDGVGGLSIAWSASPAGALISWDSAAGTSYRVEYKTNGNSSAWQLLTTATNNSGVNGKLSVVDTTVSGGDQRYYRVIYNPNGP